MISSRRRPYRKPAIVLYDTMKPFVLRADFHDFDLFAEQVRAWDLDFLQLAPGGFTAFIHQYIGEHIQIARARLGQHVEQRGCSPRNYRTFVVALNPELRMVWRAHEVDASALLAFPEGGELQSTSGPDFDVCTVSVQTEFLSRRAAALELPQPRCALAESEVLVPRPLDRERLRLLLLRFLATTTPDWATREIEIVDALLRAISRSGAAEEPRRPRIREAGLRRALAHITEHARCPLTVTELSREAGVSERTLEYAFKDRFGVAPKRYINARRLCGARRELIRAIADTRVQDVARRWGFRQLGQFARDYAMWFDESPSQTLADHRSRRRTS